MLRLFSGKVAEVLQKHDAARVLRMLYVADLRKLQDAVNTTIVALQEFTANPKTDSRLGRVGH